MPEHRLKAGALVPNCLGLHPSCGTLKHLTSSQLFPLWAFVPVKWEFLLVSIKWEGGTPFRVVESIAYKTLTQGTEHT